MNKKVLIGAVAGVGVVACVAASAKTGRCQSDSEGEPKATVWDKMRKGMEEMPEDFPPRIMFGNVEAMKANTDEILAILRENALTATRSS